MKTYEQLTEEQKRLHDSFLDGLCRQTHSWEPTDEQKEKALLYVIFHSFAEMEKELANIRAAIPEGYLIAKDTLAESVQLMVQGLKAYSKDREELLREISTLNHCLQFSDLSA